MPTKRRNYRSIDYRCTESLDTASLLAANGIQSCIRSGSLRNRGLNRILPKEAEFYVTAEQWQESGSCWFGGYPTSLIIATLRLVPSLLPCA